VLPKRLHISKSATEILRMMKGRTGLTPNIACRIALLKSLEDGKSGGLRKTDLTGSEFNAPTLFGDQASAFEALLRQVHGTPDAKLLPTIIASHIDHGLEKIKRARSLGELVAVAL
jgi:DNA sulfur modification protein DndE